MRPWPQRPGVRDYSENWRNGGSLGGAEGAGWLPGDFRQADLVAKVDGALAAHHLRRARPGPPRVKQARHASPYVPVRELGGIRPPVRDLLVKALLPGQGRSEEHTSELQSSRMPSSA